MNHLFVDPPTVYAVLENAFAAGPGLGRRPAPAPAGRADRGLRHGRGRQPVRVGAGRTVGRSHRRAVDRQPDDRRAVHEALLLEPAGQPGRGAAVHDGRGRPGRGRPGGPLALPARLGLLQPRRTGCAAGRPGPLGRGPIRRAAGPWSWPEVRPSTTSTTWTSTPASRPPCRSPPAELGIPLDRQLTVTGGHDLRRWPAQQLRAPLHGRRWPTSCAPTRVPSGWSRSVSGFLTKYGAGVWSTTPSAGGWRSEDVTAEAEAADPPKPDTDEPGDDVTVVAGTVTHARDGSRTAIDVVETPDGTRSLRSTPL